MPPEAPPLPVPLDDLDRRLLALLQVDASLSNLTLAARAHTSPPTCLRRVRRLREGGIIDRIVAILNPAKAGRVLKAWVTVELKLHGDQHMRRFLTLAMAEPAVATERPMDSSGSTPLRSSSRCRDKMNSA